MCGIIGYLANARHAEVERGLRLLTHRGPDGEGERAAAIGNHYFWFGHRRLSIIDLEGGAQPFEKHGLVITFNGEIYNYVELASELARDHGITFRTRSDTEVLLEAYRVWGMDALHRLNGMWAFAILNTATGELFCARDRLGKKPLYYVSSDRGLFFASEPPPLFPLLARMRADNSALVAYLLGAQPPADRSFFAGIHQLPPAHVLSVSAHDLMPRVRRYWSPRQKSAAGTARFDEACEELQALLLDSVRVRLRSDVGFAVAASGGLDSTIVLAAATRNSPQPVRTVSVTFDEAFEWDETSFIEHLTEHYATRPTYVRAATHISLAEMLGEIRNVVAVLMEPTPYTSVPYVNKLYEATRRAGIKVLLEGQGADELFGGYPYFRAHQSLAMLKRWASVRDFLVAVRQRSLTARRLYYSVSTFHPFLTNQSRELVRYPELTPTVNEALVHSQQNAVLPGLLQYSDRLAMRFGIEVRLPFLDYRLVEFVNALPASFKVLGRETKRILRMAYMRDLPAQILERPKVGFGSPTTLILRQHMDKLVSTFVENGTFANSPLFHAGWRRALRGGFLRTLPSAERVLWRFIVLDLWIEHFGIEIAP